MTISWVNGSGTFGGDDVFRDGDEIAWPGWPSPVVTTYVDTGVAPGPHTYAVAGYNSSGVGPHSTAVTVTVTGSGGASGSGGTAGLGGDSATTTTSSPRGHGARHGHR